MKAILNLLRDHIRQDFNTAYYGVLSAFLGVSLLLNQRYDIENKIIDAHADTPLRIVFYFLLYGCAYYAGCAIMAIFNQRAAIFRSRWFWVFSIFGLSVLSVSSGFPYAAAGLRLLRVDIRYYYWALAVLNNLMSLALVIPPLLLFGYWTRRHHDGFGLRTRFDFRPYFVLLLLVTPLIGLASLDSAFTSYYPTYRANDAATALGWPSWAPPVIYELSYALDFLNVELIFRGFFVIGMSRLLGKDAIIPMVTTYCFLHFGKPAGEAIASIFGGYLLGIIALHVRGIWGGVIIHVGVAWLMELAAWWQKNSW